LGDVSAALDSFRRATEIIPGDKQAHFELGWTYLTVQGAYDQAEIHLEQAIESDPQFGRAFGALAISYWQRRNYEDAIPNFEQAIALSSIAARKRARSFYVTVEQRDSGDPGPSVGVVMRGDMNATLDQPDTLRATLTPEKASYDDTWANARGAVTFDARTGAYTVEMADLPRPGPGEVYVGWFEGVYTLSGDPFGTGPLQWRADGSVQVDLEAEWVSGPAIDYLYTLGLAYFYMAECDKAYPLFDAALQIDPEEPNALEGIRLCRASE
jgi:tetratricopeptide (TPR) repeat protein